MKKVPIRTVKTLSKVLTICEELSKAENYVLVDFKNTKFIDSNFTAIFGAYFKYLKNRGIKVSCTKPEQPKVFTTLSKNGFLPSLDKKYKKLNDNTETVIEYQQFQINDISAQQKFFDLLNDGLLKKRGLINVSEKVLNEVTKSIIEIFSNSASHSNSKPGIFCAGQFFTVKKRLDITIVDMGVGIPSKVNEFLNKDMESNLAIEWSTKRLNSTRDDIGGLGLHLLKELIKLTKGKLEIVSSNGYYYIIEGKEGSRNLDFYFPGTIVNIEFKINDKFYSLKGENK